MRRPAFIAAALIVCLGIAPAEASSIIDFDDLGLANYAQVPTGYGSNLSDTPDVTVGYSSLNGDGTLYGDHLLFWNDGYGDLSKIAFAINSGKIAEVRLDAAPGYEVQLNSFLLAGYNQADLVATTIRVLDGSGAILWDASSLTVKGAGATHSTYTPNVSASSLRIQWGVDWNIGIDDIAFDQVAVTAVPEPAGVAMLAIGGVAAALVARRKRA